jgi:hypothetical protein
MGKGGIRVWTGPVYVQSFDLRAAPFPISRSQDSYKTCLLPGMLEAVACEGVRMLLVLWRQENRRDWDGGVGGAGGY